MRWKFWKPVEYDDGFYPQPAKKRTTLAELSERIIMRQMKNDPTGYGLDVAERVKKVGVPSNNQTQPSLLEQLQEMQQVQETLKSLGGGEGGGTVKAIAEVISVLPQVLETLRAQQAQPEVRYVERPQVSPPMIQTNPEPEAEKRKAQEIPVISTMVVTCPQ